LAARSASHAAAPCARSAWSAIEARVPPFAYSSTMRSRS
jgi:hypothetical protein